MSNNEANKTISISTIPIPKLTVLMNNFICNTITHLNKLSVKGDEKLADFDKKLNDLEIMTTLLESKLNSLPEKIRSTYPELQPCSLDDINPINQIVNQPGNLDGKKEDENEDEKENEKESVEKDEKEIEGENPEVAQQEGGNLSPQEDLEKFLSENESYRNLCTMLKLGVPPPAVRQKALVNQFDLDIFDILLEKARKVYPQIN